jgi:hypothetical protein
MVFAVLLVKNGEIFGDCNGKLPKGKAEQNDWMAGWIDRSKDGWMILGARMA